jgi:hypothetical protein
MMVARDGVEPPTPAFSGYVMLNRGWKSWVQNISLAKAVVLVRIDPQPQAMKISLIGVRLFFRGQLDEICLHSVSELRTL